MRQLTFVLCALFILSSSNIILAQNEVELLPDGIVVPRMATAPANASSTEGQLYYNTTDDQFEYFDGTTWQPLVTSGGTGNTPYKIEDLVNADTYVITTDNSAAGLGDNISIGVDGNYGMRIKSNDAKELSLEFTGANDNVLIGEDSGVLKTSGSKNVFVGDNAGAADKIGIENTFIGADAGKARADIFGQNVFVGAKAGEQGVIGIENVYIGFESGKKNQGNGNVFIGHQAGDDQGNTNERLIINNNSLGTTPLIYGRFGNTVGFVRIGGDLEILPQGNSVNPKIRMPDADGNMDEIIRRNTGTGDVVIGDVSANGGSLGLRADGDTFLSVLADGTIKFWPMSDPPGACDASFAGQVYFDSDDEKLKACGRGGAFNCCYAWYNMF